MKNKTKVIFAGRFSESGAHTSLAASAAGDIVQKQIIIESQALLGSDSVYFISMSPTTSWPRGEFFIKGFTSKKGKHISYINIPLLRDAILGFNLLIAAISLKPTLIIQYNSHFFNNIAIAFLKKIAAIKSCLILQDIKKGSSYNKSTRLYTWFSNKAIDAYDHYLPITKKVASTLGLNENKYSIFHGGITAPGFKALEHSMPSSEHGVFAGALERYNGLDKLLESWVNSGTTCDLHIFGRGRLSELAKEYSEKNPNIHYHGHLEQNKIDDWQIGARYNFCFRYSEDLEEEMFFPSKFFNACCCPGLLVVNDFKNLPSFMKKLNGCLYDITQIKTIFSLSNEELASEAAFRRNAVLASSEWKDILRKIFALYGV